MGGGGLEDGGPGLASATCCATVSGELRRPWEEARGREEREKESRGVGDDSLEGEKNNLSANEG